MYESVNISYSDIIKFHDFANTTEVGGKRPKGRVKEKREGDFTGNNYISQLSNCTSSNSS